MPLPQGATVEAPIMFLRISPPFVKLLVISYFVDVVYPYHISFGSLGQGASIHFKSNLNKNAQYL